MRNRTKSEVIAEITLSTMVDEQSVQDVVNTLFQVIKKHVAKGERVVFRKFGSFEKLQTKAKMGMDITRKKAINIPASAKPKFIPSQDFKDVVK